ncbi:MAG: HAD family hydrolase [Thomasclavelia sp.]
MIKNIVFDMGNVILRWDPDYIAGKLSQNKTEKQIIINELFSSKYWLMFDQGIVNEKQIIDSFDPKHLQLLRHALTHWHDYFEPFNKIVALIKELKLQGYKIYLLSNCSMQFYDYYSKVPAFKYFDDFYISAKYHLIKPDLAIYQDFLTRYDLVAEESVFIDDVSANVEGAKKAGMLAYQYDGNLERLQAYLQTILK